MTEYGLWSYLVLQWIHRAYDDPSAGLETAPKTEGAGGPVKEEGVSMSVKRYALVSTALTGLCMMSTVSAQTAPPSNDDVSEIVVSGFRKSSELALDAKRSEDRIVDVISAEDIGRLPAENIAEAI